MTPVLCIESIHLHKHLVQGLLPLVVAASEPGSARPPHRIELIDEDDTWSVLAPLFEEVSNPARTDAYEHLDEIRARHMEEGDIRLSGRRFCDERLSGAGHAHEEYALWDLCTHFEEFFGVFQIVDHFHKFILGFFLTGDIVEGNLLVRIVVEFCTALSKAEGLVVVALHLSHHNPDEGESENPWCELEQYLQGAYAPDRTGYAYALFLKFGHELRIEIGYPCDEWHLRPIFPPQGAFDVALIDDAYGFYLTQFEIRQKR